MKTATLPIALSVLALLSTPALAVFDDQASQAFEPRVSEEFQFFYDEIDLPDAIAITSEPDPSESTADSDIASWCTFQTIAGNLLIKPAWVERCRALLRPEHLSKFNEMYPVTGEQD